MINLFARTAALMAILPLFNTALAENSFTPKKISTWQHYPANPNAPNNAPNILLVMTDDVGFGASSTFGGSISTPTFDSVAQQGLRYTSFHTTSMCSPTRAALLTGRNHHAVGNGAIANFSRDLDGYTSAIPETAATLARVLRDNGYATAFLGKNHNTPEWETTAAGPFDRWPNGWGFDYFYGFNDAWENQFAPQLIENRNPIRTPSDGDYILDRDLVDHLINWIKERKTLTPDKPFFAYLAPGSPHTPHQAPADWIAKYNGKFDQGWDHIRHHTFDQQKALGLIPADAEISPRPEELPPWDSLSPSGQKVAARMMEVYAAQLSFFDHQLGRVIEELRTQGQLENTLIIYIQGDNGADLASFRGSTNEWGAFFGKEPAYDDILPRLDELGGPLTFGGYPAAWGWAMNTPYPWGKSMAGFLGGSRVGMAMSLPRRIKNKNGIRNQFHHVIDIAPTIYELAGISPPEMVDGIKQQRMDGVSMAYTFDHSDSSSRNTSQYFEMMGNIGYYNAGWLVTTTPARMPWDRTSPRTPLPSKVEDFKWHLYDLKNDPTQSKNIAALHPKRVKQMIRDFDLVAQENHVFPLENDVMTLLNPNQRPSLTLGRSNFIFYPREQRYVAAALPPLGGNWKAVTRVVIDKTDASGPIYVQGDRFNGWGLRLVQGKPELLIRQSDAKGDMLRVASPIALSLGEHEISIDVRRPASGPRTAATIRLAIDGKVVAQSSGTSAGIIARNAYVGHSGPVPLIDDTQLDTCQCTILKFEFLLPPS